jgi:peptidoglycan/xylan/chitin deacetylase (PgdA/CDA1 family)
MLRPAFSLLSPAGRRARLSTLIFHRVHAKTDPMFPGEPDAARFDAVCGWLARWFNVLPLDEALSRFRTGSLPARAACITFDDGYADNHDVALPILRRHRLPATFFIATGFLDGGRMFNDGLVELVRRSPLPELALDGLSLELPEGARTLRLGDNAARRSAAMALIGAVKYRPADDRLALVDELRRRAGVAALPDDLMMRSAQVKALHEAGMGIGAHTVTHPILARLTDTEARQEIERGKLALESIIGAPVPLFAYPNGRPGADYGASTVRIVRDLGFAAAVSTAWGSAGPSTDLYQLPRFTPWDASELRFGLRLLANLPRVPSLLDVPA